MEAECLYTYYVLCESGWDVVNVTYAGNRDSISVRTSLSAAFQWSSDDLVVIEKYACDGDLKYQLKALQQSAKTAKALIRHGLHEALVAQSDIFLHSVKLTYFRDTGKYGSDGAFVSCHRHLHKIWEEVISLRDKRMLPGMVQGSYTAFILIDVPTHPLDNPRLIINKTASATSEAST